MEALAGLFDPTDDEVGSLPHSLPPEPGEGNIEYKLKLVNPSRTRFEHLVTQMKWRLREGQGEAIYEIGVEDCGLLAGLSEEEMTSSLATLHQMAQRLGATISVLRERIIDTGDGKPRKAAEILVRKVPDNQQTIDLRVAVLGNIDAGKSTLLGVLTQGQLDNGRGRARLNLFRHLHEIQTGHTSSISHEILGFDSHGTVVNYSDSQTAEEICEHSAKLVTFLDLAGHHRYMKTTILGLTGYAPHYAMLIVSACQGIAGTTREHLGLALALDVPIFVVITKTDLCPKNVTERTVAQLDNVLKSPGCRRVPVHVLTQDDALTSASSLMTDNVTPVFCVSSVNGSGLDLLTTFLNVLSPCAGSKQLDKLMQETTEFQVDETFRISGMLGVVVTGMLVQGTVREGQPLVLGPANDGSFLPVTVHSIHRNRAPCRVVRAGQGASLALTWENFQNFDDDNQNQTNTPLIRRGMILVDQGFEPKPCLYFQASVCILFHSTAIHTGFQATLYTGSIRQTVVLEGIMVRNNLHTGDQATVICRFLKQPECVRLGTRILFRQARTKIIGRVTQVFPLEPEADGQR